MSLAAILFVDDTDLLHLNMTREESVTETLESMQDSVIDWGELLIATGGTLKPEKCFWHLMSFDWDSKGKWKYVEHHNDPNGVLVVPMPDGTVAPIEHLSVDTSKKTLGVMTCPSGKSKGSLDLMKEKATNWLNQASSGTLHRRGMWFSITHQFWPSVGYGLSSCMASLKELDTVLSSITIRCCHLAESGDPSSEN